MRALAGVCAALQIDATKIGPRMGKVCGASFPANLRRLFGKTAPLRSRQDSFLPKAASSEGVAGQA